KLRANPDDARSYALLGLAYEQRARETGDPTYYTKADGVLHRALALEPNDLIATGGLGSLALSRHRFREALALGREAPRIFPNTARSTTSRSPSSSGCSATSTARKASSRSPGGSTRSSA